jgi:hypothetical protein
MHAVRPDELCAPACGLLIHNAILKEISFSAAEAQTEGIVPTGKLITVCIEGELCLEFICNISVK